MTKKETCNFLKVRDHALNKPRFIDKAGLPGSINSPLTGEEVGFEIELNDKQEVKVGYYTPGCGYYHGAASGVAALTDGKPLGDVLDLCLNDVKKYFDNYPDEKCHYIELSIEAFKRALASKGINMKVSGLENSTYNHLLPDFDFNHTEPDPFALTNEGLVPSEIKSHFYRFKELFNKRNKSGLKAYYYSIKKDLLSTGKKPINLLLLLLEFNPLDPTIELEVIKHFNQISNTSVPFAISGVSIRMNSLFIPSGEFIRGNSNGHRDESPERTILLDSYWIDSNPFESNKLAVLGVPGKVKVSANLPAIFISWKMAKEISLRTGGNLPTEEQWEKAAKGGIYLDGDLVRSVRNLEPNRRYPWGNSSPDKRVSYPPNRPKGPQRSNSNPGHRSPYGLYNMAGNVWEWCDNLYDENKYSGIKKNQNKTAFVIRGGAWDDIGTNDVSTSGRYYDDWFASERVHGFRPIHNKAIWELISV